MYDYAPVAAALAAVAATIAITLIVAIAAIFIVRLAVKGTDSADRASVLDSAAQVIRALRSKK